MIFLSANGYDFEAIEFNFVPFTIKKMALIEIENMEFHANHGHYAEEQVIGNTFLVDLKFEYNSDKAKSSDNLKDAVNYQKAYEIVKREMGVNSHLLEHLGGRILDSLINELSGIEVAQVKVSKVNPPMGGKIQKVSVTLNRKAK